VRLGEGDGSSELLLLQHVAVVARLIDEVLNPRLRGLDLARHLGNLGPNHGLHDQRLAKGNSLGSKLSEKKKNIKILTKCKTPLYYQYHSHPNKKKKTKKKKNKKKKKKRIITLTDSSRQTRAKRCAVMTIPRRS
jgi:hypothetical protein